MSTMDEASRSHAEEHTTVAMRALRPGPEASGYTAVRSALLERMFGEPRASIGRYALRERLGEGGFGVVYAAWDPELRREVAIKLLRSDGEHSLEHEDELLNEARIAGGLSHPNIVAVHDVGRYERDVDHEDADACVFIVMERIFGQTLHAWLKSPRPLAAVLGAFEQAGRGLAAAHAAGLAHRDFKPSNVLVDREERVRVVDFGLAGFVEDATPDIDADEPERFAGTMPTQVLVGTPQYMAPEQLSGERAGPASDQYAFCLVLREALTRTRVFAGSLPKQHRAKLKGPPPWPRGSVTGALRRVIDRGLAPDPVDRWPSMHALLDALDAVRRRKKLRRGAGLVGAALLLGPLGMVVSRDSPCREAAESMHQMWDARARDRVRASLLDTGAAHAEHTARTVDDQLDDLADRWALEQRAACEVSRAEPTAAAAPLACLARLRIQVAETIAILERGDRDVVDTAAMLVAGLPSPEYCQTSQEAPPNSEAEEHVLAKLARADVHIVAGHFEDADRLITTARAEAERLAVRPLVAAAGSMAGSMLAKQGRFEAAEARLRQSLELALEVDAPEVAALSGATLSYVLGNELARHDEGLTVAAVATALGRGLGSSHPAHATTLFSQAIVLRHAGRLEEAEAAHRQALEIRRRLYPLEHPKVLDSMAMLSIVLGAQGRHAEARASMQEALEIRRRMQGADHPDVATSEISLGVMLTSEGELDEAREVLEHATETLRRSLGPQHVDYATALQNLAAVEHLSGSSEAAIASLERSLQIQVDALGEDHPSVALVRGNIGAICLHLGRLERARSELGRALEVERAHLGPRDARLAPRLTKLAEVEARLGHIAEADALRAEARALEPSAASEPYPGVDVTPRQSDR